MSLFNDITEARKELERLRTEYNSLTSRPAPIFDTQSLTEANAAVEAMGKSVKQTKKDLNDLERGFGGIYNEVKGILSELTKTGTPTKDITKEFRVQEKLLTKLKSEQQGFSKLTLSELKTLKEKQNISAQNIRDRAKDLIISSRMKTLSGEALDAAIKRKLASGKISEEEAAIIRGAKEGFKVLEDTNKALNKRIAFEEQVNKNLGLGGNLIKGIGGALKKMGMGGLASQLGLDEAQEKMREVSEEIENSGDEISDAEKKRKVLSAGFSSMGKSLIKNLTDPLAIGLFLFNSMVDALTSVDKLSGELAKGLNMSYSEAAALSSELSSAANMSGELKLSAVGLGEALLAVNEITGVYTIENSKNLETFQMLHKTAGLTYEQMGGIYSVTQATGGDLLKNTEEVLAQSTLTAQSYGVQINSKKVLADIGKISKATTLSLGGSAAELSKALTTSQALGISMSQMESIADGLLNFEQSISNEMEAEMLTGKSLNLEKARSLALNNDIAGAAAEIAKQVGTAADFSKMNRIQQEALAKATGLSKEDLANSLFVQEQLANSVGKEYEEKKKIIDELQAKGLSQEEIKKKLGKESLADLKAQSSVQENINDSIAKMKEGFVSIAAPLMQIITPIVDILTPAVGALGYAFEAISLPIKVMGDGIKMFVDGLKEASEISYAILGFTASILILRKQATGQSLAEMGIAKLKKGYLLAEKATLFVINGIRNKSLKKDIGQMAMKAFTALGGIPVIGPALGIAAAAAALAYGYKLYNADDMMSPGSNSSGYGSRTLMGPEGAIALNNKDTVIAGTNLFKGNDVMSGPAGSMQMPDNSEAKKTNELLRAVLSQPKPQPIITMNDVALGTAVDMGAFSIQ